MKQSKRTARRAKLRTTKGTKTKCGKVGSLAYNESSKLISSIKGIQSSESKEDDKQEPAA